MSAPKLASSQDSVAEDEQVELELSQIRPRGNALSRCRRWLASSTSTFTVLWILLLSEAVRGIVIPTQAKYVNSLNGDSSFLGLTVGAFSGGRLASTVLLGVLAGALTYQQMFLGSSFILMLACLMYSLSGAANSKWLLFFARIGQGLGAGSLGLVRAYFAETYDESSRTRIMSIVAGVQYAGFALFPGVGDLLDLIVAKWNWNLSALNSYTTPSWVMMLMVAISIAMLFAWFKEPPHLKRFKLKDLVPFYKPAMAKTGLIGQSIRKAFGFAPQRVVDVEMDELSQASSASSSASSATSPLPSHGKSSDEELLSSIDGRDVHSAPEMDDSNEISIKLEEPVSEEVVPKPKQRFTLVTAIWLAFLGINFLIRVVLGTVEVLGATLFDSVTRKYILSGETAYSTSSGTFYTILGVFGVGVVFALALGAKRVPDEVPFLASLLALLLGSLILIGDMATMSLARFTIGTAMIYTIGYPLAQSVVVSIFSKIPASARNQAVSMSWIGSSGSVGRIVGPIIVGHIYQKSGSASVFVFNASISALILVISIATLYFMKKIPND